MVEQTQYTVDHRLTNELRSQTIKKEGNKLLSFISNRTPTLEDAEDILQDVYYEFVQSETLESTVAWLYRVARNKITDWYRKMKPERLDDIAFSSADEEEGLMLSDRLPSMDTAADKQLLLKLITEVVADALSELPQNQREVFVMHEIEGKPFKEIATLTRL
jgi:RNA polymerase sigma factor (sigma-70 family)